MSVSAIAPMREDNSLVNLANKVFEAFKSIEEIEQYGVFLIMYRGMTPEQAGVAACELEDAIDEARHYLATAPR